jgi:transcriptional regulator with XRE-family HTH domain
MNDINQTISENLVRLRTKAGLTQLQLANLLNYSDKAVSKWERGESLPDIHVFIKLASIYHISIDDIVNPVAEKEVRPHLNLKKKRLLITLLSVGLTVFIATGIFAILYFIPQTAHYAYFAYIAMPLVIGILLTVFTCLWSNKFLCAAAVTLLLWSIITLLYVVVITFVTNEVYLSKAWILFVVGAPFQALIIFWFIFRKVK